MVEKGDHNEAQQPKFPTIAAWNTNESPPQMDHCDYPFKGEKQIRESVTCHEGVGPNSKYII